MQPVLRPDTSTCASPPQMARRPVLARRGNWRFLRCPPECEHGDFWG